LYVPNIWLEMAFQSLPNQMLLFSLSQDRSPIFMRIEGQGLPSPTHAPNAQLLCKGLSGQPNNLLNSPCSA
jgi:hypothetical protein